MKRSNVRRSQEDGDALDEERSTKRVKRHTDQTCTTTTTCTHTDNRVIGIVGDRPRLSLGKLTCSKPVVLRTFAVKPTSDFIGEFPFFSRPQELGHFSLEIDRTFANDNRHLKHYHPLSKESDLNLDLRQGFETFVKRDDDVKERLDNVMKWIVHNKKHFLRPQRNVSVCYDIKDDDLIESLGIDFIAWRGHFTKFLCTPYENRDGWEMAATLFRGTIYISEVETEEERQRRLGMNHWEQQCMYGGYKFEQYVTSDGKKSPDTSQPVNNIEAFCSVVRSDLGPYKLLYSGEVDCLQSVSKDKPPGNYLELKTSRKWYSQKNENNFYRYKLVKWWAQSFLVGIPQVICGFRDDEGVVREIKHFKTMQMPKLSMGWWNGSVCFNFLVKFLDFIKSVTVIDDPSVVYLFERKPGNNVISYTVHQADGQQFIPEWYIRAFVKDSRPSSVETKATS
ncbi:decapping and exoribonuclease protein-like [Acanthaster planci]|uniref:Decapping nuclease n=1 Tax=Acanthaster planci TaxID=133434 RepID=A0A8B7ZC34_ACAPL|nr:decapping and exoribonuclease protein-like [Acanthaster planci]